MPDNKKIFLPLTGGLGNQLFQYAAALSRSGHEIVFDSKLGAPRKGVGAGPVLEDYAVRSTTYVKHPRVLSKLFAKTNGYLLRSGLNPNCIEKLWPIRSAMRLFGSFVMGVYFKTTLKLIQATNNGYFQMPSTYRNELLIGYFQSYIWADSPSVKSEMSGLRLKFNPKNLSNFIEKYKGQKILCVHIRRGDYRNEADFGLLSATYYERGIDEVSRVFNFDRIWLFSDEPDFAFSFLPERFKGKVDVVPDFGGSASATLELMRHAGAYVIANSSLSWWGAWLSYSDNPVVIAPDPWFSRAPEPQQIIPGKWLRISAWNHDNE
jgi:hypothetical protein